MNNGMNAKKMRNGSPWGYQENVSSKPLTRLNRMSLYHFIGDGNQGTGISEQGIVNNFQFLILNSQFCIVLVDAFAQELDVSVFVTLVVGGAGQNVTVGINYKIARL